MHHGTKTAGIDTWVLKLYGTIDFNVYPYSPPPPPPPPHTHAHSQSRGGRPPSNVARRIRDEGKTGFPYGLVGDMVVKYSSNNMYQLKGRSIGRMSTVCIHVAYNIDSPSDMLI